MCSELASVTQLEDIIKIIRKKLFTFLETLMDCFAEWQSMSADKLSPVTRRLPTEGADGFLNPTGTQKWQSRFLGNFTH